MSEAVMPSVMVVLLTLTSATAVAVDSQPAANISQLSGQISLVFRELGLDVSSDEIAECMVSGEAVPDGARIMECLRVGGTVPELTIPSQAEITASTRPMLIRTTGNSWFALRDSAEGFLRPVVPEGAPEVRIPFERFNNTWSGFAIMVSRRVVGKWVPEPAKVKFEEEEQDFGRVPRGRKVEVEFPFVNVGERPLRFRNASPEKTMLQIQARPEREEYAPGDSGVLAVRFDTSQARDSVTVSADLMTTDPENMFVSLNVTGEVADPVTAIPDRVEFAPLVRGATAAALFHLMSFEGSPFRVVNVSTDQPFVKASISPGQPVMAPKVSITVITDSSEMEVGPFEAKCTIELAPAELGSVSLDVSGEVVAPE